MAEPERLERPDRRGLHPERGKNADGRSNHRLRGGVDLFKIYVPDFSLFSATTDDPMTDAGLDTQLFLFAPDGTGIAVNDDINGGNLFSNLPVGDPFYSGRPGGYY